MPTLDPGRPGLRIGRWIPPYSASAGSASPRRPPPQTGGVRESGIRRWTAGGTISLQPAQSPGCRVRHRDVRARIHRIGAASRTGDPLGR
jgi:hypothetical protein